MSIAKPTQTVSVSTTQVRATPISRSQRAREGAKGFGLFLMRAVEGAASFVPGGSVATASLRAAAGAGSLGRSLKSGGVGGAGGLSEEMQYAQLIDTQIAMQQQNIEFSTMSNVLKSEHDTKKQIVTNYR